MRSRSPRRRRSNHRDRSHNIRSPTRKKTSNYESDRHNQKLESPKQGRIHSNDRKQKEPVKKADDKSHKRNHSFSSDEKRKRERSHDRRDHGSPAEDRKRSRSPIRRDHARKGRSTDITERGRRLNEANIHNTGRLGKRRHSNERNQNRTSNRGEKSRNDSNRMKGSNTSDYAGRGRGGHIEPDPPVPRRFDQTEFSINDRFSSFSITKPLVVDETISVEIERNIDGNDDFVIPDYFDPQVVTVLRRSDEGKKPFYLREEFLRRGFDDDEKEYSERRVVKVVSTMDNFGARREKQDVLSIWDDMKNINVNKMLGKLKPENDNLRRAQTDKDRRRDRREDSRDRMRFRNKDERRLDIGHTSRSGIVLRDQDLRLALNRDRDDRLVKNIIRRRDDEGFGAAATRSDVRNLDELQPQHGRDMSELPDFSKRPGKYTYDAWKDKPELIPKGSSYFEHDNRDGGDIWETRRGRGQGFYRGGGWSRGRSGFSGRGMGRVAPASRNENRYTSARPDFDHWKHDKFEELEDNKPTSTTEK